MAGAAGEVTVVLSVLDDAFRVREHELMGNKGAVALESSQDRAIWVERDVLSVRTRQCSCCKQCWAQLSILPHVLSPTGFCLSNEVPGVGACCSLGTVHRGPGPSSGNG